MKIITLSGLDGSGKSTQIELLKSYLESQNKRVFYFHAVNFSLAKKLVDFRNKHCLICKISGKCKVYKEKSVTKANHFQIYLRKIFLKIDIWRFKNLLEKLKRDGFDYILSDRYFYDSVVNIEYLSAIPKAKPLASQRLSLWRITMPDLAIYLDINPENIMSRERVPDQGIEYLQAKKELYDAKITYWYMKIIDGNRDKNVIFEEIKQLTA